MHRFMYPAFVYAAVVAVAAALVVVWASREAD